jgi:hypothetical protein
MGHSYDGPEHRRYLRVFKNYKLVFSFKGSPDKKSDETFIKDISKGGVRFTTSQPIKLDTHLVFEIGIPYIAPKKLTLEGLVISCKEVNPGLVYEIRAGFNSLDGETLQVLDMVEKINPKDRRVRQI